MQQVKSIFINNCVYNGKHTIKVSIKNLLLCGHKNILMLVFFLLLFLSNIAYL